MSDNDISVSPCTPCKLEMLGGEYDKTENDKESRTPGSTSSLRDDETMNPNIDHLNERVLEQEMPFFSNSISRNNNNNKSEDSDELIQSFDDASDIEFESISRSCGALSKRLCNSNGKPSFYEPFAQNKTIINSPIGSFDSKFSATSTSKYGIASINVAYSDSIERINNVEPFDKNNGLKVPKQVTRMTDYAFKKKLDSRYKIPTYNSKPESNWYNDCETKENETSNREFNITDCPKDSLVNTLPKREICKESIETDDALTPGKKPKILSNKKVKPPYKRTLQTKYKWEEKRQQQDYSKSKVVLDVDKNFNQLMVKKDEIEFETDEKRKWLAALDNETQINEPENSRKTIDSVTKRFHSESENARLQNRQLNSKFSNHRSKLGLSLLQQRIAENSKSLIELAQEMIRMNTLINELRVQFSGEEEERQAENSRLSEKSKKNVVSKGVQTDFRSMIPSDNEYSRADAFVGFDTLQLSSKKENLNTKSVKQSPSTYVRNWFHRSNHDERENQSKRCGSIESDRMTSKKKSSGGKVQDTGKSTKFQGGEKASGHGHMPKNDSTASRECHDFRIDLKKKRKEQLRNCTPLSISVKTAKSKKRVLNES